MEKVLSDKKMIALFVLPAFIVFISIFLIPVIISFALSLTNWNGVGMPEFIGIKNYKYIFQNDDTFWIAMKNTFFFLVASLISQMSLGFVMAVFLTSGVKFSNGFKNIYYFPAILSGTAVGFIWRFVFNTRIGLINGALTQLGLGEYASAWLGGTEGFIPSGMWCIAFVAMWQFMGTMMVLYIAAINGIPTQTFEAAYLDGASKMQTVKYVTIPLLRPMFKTTIILSCVGSLKFFDLVYTMTGGGPGHLTEVLATHIYTRAFTMWQYGYGNALSVLLVILCVIVSMFVNKVFVFENYEM